MPPQILILTADQEAKIRSFFGQEEAPDLADITRSIFTNPILSGKTVEAKAVKRFCNKNNLKFSVRTVIKKGLMELTEEHKKEINNKFRALKSLELTQVVFKDPELSNLSQEYRTVMAYVEELKKQIEGPAKQEEILDIGYKYKSDELATNEYRPPSTTKQTIARINRFLNSDWQEENLKKQQLFEVSQLKRYLNVFRFLYQINCYKIQGDRDLFEDAFIRYTHDKPDLTQEDIDQFITLCNQIVRAADIQRRVEDLKTTIAGGDLSMTINEAINVLQTELNACEKIKSSLYESLTQKRNKRLEERKDGAERIINLVQAWKDEEFRKKTIHLADLENIKIQEEGEKINSMSEIKALLRGATLEELVNG